ncbi:MAG: peptide deformylase [Candidatus Doudnabacteria bacterium CG10_big_fil_rev_8_21_14_0_10_41_10]|uniref:Peptide deformylase n=1 Tax=Candidatus Doudnabacteria bacterium CG10_big_fil_rev_8_21_14_0_10_41_10 TaxID=1974551 RepID=A0A2H0VD03_9BACT|nr:MAG: peptide deformylase [Candidatus Doudnabacteria bacterium CG10_big_fil_rev_8_21_14_0_10_41_10]
MPRFKLVTSPNEILRNKNAEIKFPLSSDIKKLIDQMKYDVKRFNGIGLAAPQIGKNLKLAIINLEHYNIPAFPIINPKITSKSFRKETMEEGCLSIPGKFGVVKRPKKITVKFYREDGKKVKLKVDGLTAKVFQHEIDHLNGIIILDKWDKKTVYTPKNTDAKKTE